MRPRGSTSDAGLCIAALPPEEPSDAARLCTLSVALIVVNDCRQVGGISETTGGAERLMRLLPRHRNGLLARNDIGALAADVEARRRPGSSDDDGVRAAETSKPDADGKRKITAGCTATVGVTVVALLQ